MVPGKFSVSEIVFRSPNLGGVFNESRNLVFLRFFASRILEFWLRGLGVSDFCLLANGFDQNHDKSAYYIS